MARNVEIKARVDDLEAVGARAAALAGGAAVEMSQDDTFFRCDNGRLKLRVIDEGEGELIFYRRADAAAPRESFYLRSRAPDPDSLRRSLALAYGVVGRVRKKRRLFLVGRTRIHLDRVEGQGEYLELEAVLDEDEDVEVGVRELLSLMKQLGVGESELVSRAYVDLLGPSAA